MEFLMRQGDYVSDGRGGLVELDGAEAVLQRVLFRLRAHRGAMPFLPELGSRLYLLYREKPSQWQSAAEQAVAQALEPEPEVFVEGVALEQQAEGRLGLTVELSWRGQPLKAEIAL